KSRKGLNLGRRGQLDFVGANRVLEIGCAHWPIRPAEKRPGGQGQADCARVFHWPASSNGQYATRVQINSRVILSCLFAELDTRDFTVVPTQIESAARKDRRREGPSSRLS